MDNSKTTSGLQKITNAEPTPCMSPEHDPPQHIALEPGTYEYTCPACGQKTTLIVPHIW